MIERLLDFYCRIFHTRPPINWMHGKYTCPTCQRQFEDVCTQKGEIA